MREMIQNIRQNIRSTIGRYYLFNALQNAVFFGAVLVPFYTQWGHISVTMIQLLQSWFMFWLFILEIPTGAFADLAGRRVSLIIGSIITAIGFFVYGLAPLFPLFLLGEFLAAVGMAFVSGANTALLFDALKEAGLEHESKKILGRADSWKFIVAIVSAPLGGVIAQKFGLNIPTIISAIPLLLAAMVAWTIKEPKIISRRPVKDLFKISRESFEFLRSHRDLRVLAIDAVAVAAGTYFVIWFYQLLLIKINVGIVYFGVINSLLLITETIISGNYVFLEKLFGSARNLIRFGAISAGVSFIIVGLFPNLITVSLFIIFGGGFGLTRLTLMISHMNKFIPSDNRATVLSSISLMRRFALVVLNPIAGFLADKSLPMTLVLIGLLPLLVGIFSPVKEEMLDT